MAAHKISKEDFEKEIQARFPAESFTVLSYEGTKKPCVIQCNTCGEEIKVSEASNFLAKNKAFGCKKCHGLWRNREVKLKAIKERYDILGTSVKDTHTYYHVKCKECGHERNTTLANLYKNLDCGCKTDVFRNRSEEEFISKVNRNSIDGSYKLVSRYTNQTTKVLLQHSCGFIWSVRPADIIHGDTRCPKCRKKISKGAKIIANVLDKNHVLYEMEKTLDNSRLRFDFYLEKGDLKIAVEYNGSQHYKETPYFQTTLAQQQDRDSRKREYCKSHNILLYELPYTLTDKELENKVQEIINKFNDYPVKE